MKRVGIYVVVVAVVARGWVAAPTERCTRIVTDAFVVSGRRGGERREGERLRFAMSDGVDGFIILTTIHCTRSLILSLSLLLLVDSCNYDVCDG